MNTVERAIHVNDWLFTSWQRCEYLSGHFAQIRSCRDLYCVRCFIPACKDLAPVRPYKFIVSFLLTSNGRRSEQLFVAVRQVFIEVDASAVRPRSLFDSWCFLVLERNAWRLSRRTKRTIMLVSSFWLVAILLHVSMSVTETCSSMALPVFSMTSLD